MKSLLENVNEVFVQSEYLEVIENHIAEGISITESYLRYGSDSWLELVEAYRVLHGANMIELSEDDKFIVERLQTGKKAYYKDGDTYKKVELDLPKINYAKDASKRYIVYRKGEGEHDGLPLAKAIVWGDKNSTIGNDDEGRVNSFWARQQCDSKKDMDTPGWWACYAPEKFGDLLKLVGGKQRW